MVRAFWADRSPLVRTGMVAAVLAAAAVGWWLGSPLFIRTTLNEDLPTVTARPAGTGAVATAGATAAQTAAPQAGPIVLMEGELQFVDNLHNGRGPVRILRVGDLRILRFENVAITNAPDVHVYLSRDIGGKWSEATSLYLGPLKATNGSFNYDIPAGTDLAPYRSVVVWCRAFAVLVTWADLRPA